MDDSNLAVTRHHDLGDVPGWVDMNPTGLPELAEPTKTPRNFNENTCFRTKYVRGQKSLLGPSRTLSRGFQGWGRTAPEKL